MFRLYSKNTDWLIPIAQLVKEHITHMGGECVNRRQARLMESVEKEKNEDADFIKELLDLHDKCERTLVVPVCVCTRVLFFSLFSRVSIEG